MRDNFKNPKPTHNYILPLAKRFSATSPANKKRKKSQKEQELYF
jgi:hypothetical protein